MLKHVALLVYWGAVADALLEWRHSCARTHTRCLSQPDLGSSNYRSSTGAAVDSPTYLACVCGSPETLLWIARWIAPSTPASSEECLLCLPLFMGQRERERERDICMIALAIRLRASQQRSRDSRVSDAYLAGA